MSHEAHDFRIERYVVTSKCNPYWGVVAGEWWRVRLTYRDEAGFVHEAASGPDTEKGRRWLEEFARDIVNHCGMTDFHGVTYADDAREDALSVR